MTYRSLTTLFLILVCLIFSGSTISQSETDYTGFWKSDCEDAFGIQIIKHGTDQYTTRFCGPGGGCDQPPDTSRLESIENNPDYLVISPNELHEMIDDTKYGTLYRCSTETNPVLEYPDKNRLSQWLGLLTFLGINLIYLLIAILITRKNWNRYETSSQTKQSIYRCGLLALLFTPSIHYTVLFAIPSFAMLALIYTVITVPFGGFFLLPMQLVFSAVPMLAIWLILILFSMIRKKLNRV